MRKKSSLNIKIKNCYKDSVVSPSYLNLLASSKSFPLETKRVTETNSWCYMAFNNVLEQTRLLFPRKNFS